MTLDAYSHAAGPVPEPCRTIISSTPRASHLFHIHGYHHGLSIMIRYGIPPDLHRIRRPSGASRRMLFADTPFRRGNRRILTGKKKDHLQHQQPILMAVIIETFLWIIAPIRFPELKQRLFALQHQQGCLLRS